MKTFSLCVPCPFCVPFVSPSLGTQKEPKFRLDSGPSLIIIKNIYIKSIERGRETLSYLSRSCPISLSHFPKLGTGGHYTPFSDVKYCVPIGGHKGYSVPCLKFGGSSSS